ncbi:glutaminase A [Ornithinimicrobium sediminis]|uniref:glutaminase A n=1 Tax=Ornithinimicrobium sediminis TaxID=2904603 RepID=UPI001E48EB57|nr:glutaminase A [Ornithinimicrobium sediminis]
MNAEAADDVQEVLAAVAGDRSGEPSAYLARLEGVDVDSSALAACSAAGETEAAGESTTEFALQSISKAFVYAFALQELGLEAVLARVGVEPSGEAFNEMSLQAGGRPFNPLINAGAIMVHGLIPGEDEDDRITVIRDGLSALAGRELSVDMPVYEAEMELSDRNLSIAHLLASNDILPDTPHEIVRGYSLQCSVAVTTEDLAMMGATLANGGVHPLTGQEVLRKDVVRQTLSVMFTCGMYDASGEWVAEVGLPAKSGVSGGLLAVVPGVMALAAYSPRLDEHGHSVRGVKACTRLSQGWDLHLLGHAAPRPHGRRVRR